MGEQELTGVAIPQLDDEDFKGYSRKTKKELDDVAAPVLEDTYIPSLGNKKIVLDDIPAPVFEDTYKNNTVKNSEGSLDDIPAPIFEDTYIPPYKNDTSTNNDINNVKAASLAEEEIKTEYKSRYVDPSTEAAKKDALNRSIKSSLNEVPTNFDEKKSREMYRELMAEQQAKLAVKGGRKTILLMVFGILMSALLYAFSTVTEFKSDSAWTDKVATVVCYCCYASGAASLLMLIRLKFIKGLSSFVFGLMIFVSLAGGGYMLTAKSNFLVNFSMLLVVVATNIYISFTLSSNESVDLYYKRRGRL